MAYNSGFPIGYNNYYPQYGTGLQTPLNAQNGNVPSGNYQNNTSPIIWVQGEAGAKSFLVAPNTTVQLWDSEEQVIYLKSADASGMPSMKVLDYTIRDAQNGSTSPVKASIGENTTYALKSDLGAIWSEIEAIQKKLERRSKKDEQSIVRNDE